MPLDVGFDGPFFARRAGLVYVHEDDPGIRRRRDGEGFTYLDPDGKPISDAETLDRIKGLAIPPAYESVWICADPNGHVQATGRDARGRKQYRYHPGWRAARDETKFARMAAFGRALPEIRRRVDHDLKRSALSHDKVVATVVRLLELTLIRVGNDQYAKDNNSFGLTTLRNRHVKTEGAALVFEFKGKSGVKHRTGVRDRRLVRIIKSLQALPGQRLFQYIDKEGVMRPVGSADVNAYLHAITGQTFTAKDFRTWAGTVAAAKALAMQGAPATDRELKHLTSLCVKATAGLLGNTPAVCRSAYIHPAVLKAYGDGRLPPCFLELEGEAYENAVLDFLTTVADQACEADLRSLARATRHPKSRP
jgi:DNA topoisomerase-1